LPTPCCGIPIDEGCTQPLSSDPKIKLPKAPLSFIRKQSPHKRVDFAIRVPLCNQEGFDKKWQVKSLKLFKTLSGG
jgi:hypothetical protein